MIKPCDLRSRTRVRLNLPVRIRQLHTSGELSEVTRTLDVSRHGFAFRTRFRYSMLATLWISLPYSVEAVFTPEFPAMPVRMEYSEDGNARVAVQFQSALVDRIRRALRTAVRLGDQDRRTRRRQDLSIPVRVRHAGVTDESLTLDISDGGLLLPTQQHYAVNQLVAVAVPFQPSGNSLDRAARVARVLEIDGLRAVGLQFIQPPAPAAAGSLE